jgi:argininosuccinate synthase
MPGKVVLAYTGGLATSLCIHWLRMKKGLEVHTFTANVGQPASLEPVAERAIELGASAAHTADLRERFARDFAFRVLRAGAVYESGYYLGKAMTRPLIVQEMVKIAQQVGAGVLAHGNAGRGNDRARFEAALAALAPSMEALAPIEEWGVVTRDEQRALARRYHMDDLLREDEETLWPTVDHNLWGIGRAHDAALLDPWAPVPEAAYRITVAPEKAPDAPAEVVVSLERGVPVALDGERLAPVALLERLNRLGGAHGVGRRDVVEDRISGVKTREVYEAPAAAILFEAHRQLERLVMSKDLLRFRATLSRKYAELVYEGLWWSELREGLDAFFDRVSQPVCGDVRLRLHKGGATVTGLRSPFSLYDPGLARAAVMCAEPGDEGTREAAGYAIRGGGEPLPIGGWQPAASPES